MSLLIFIINNVAFMWRTKLEKDFNKVLSKGTIALWRNNGPKKVY